ncbi:MAG: hypothetical protein ACT4RN_08515 [Pseudonocardia sp.]
MRCLGSPLPSYIHTSPPLTAPDTRGRTDVVLAGLDQAGPSFEARVFVDNPGADETTERSEHAGYAGTVHVYGGADPGEEGGPLPMTRTLDATGAVARAGGHDRAFTVTVVAVPYGDGVSPRDAGLDLDRLTVALRPGS